MDHFDLRYNSLILAHQLGATSLATMLGDAEKISDFISKPQPAISIRDTPQSFWSFFQRITLDHPNHGVIPWPFQQRVAGYLERSQYLVINSARQMGLTTMLTAYAAYCARQPDQTIIMTTDRFPNVLKMSECIRYLINEDLVEETKTRFILGNGSRISVVTQNEIEQTADLLLIDNAGFVHHRPCVAQRIVVAGCPRDAHSFLHHAWTEGGAEWRKLMLPWHEHPERDDAWMTQVSQSLEAAAFRREFCCEFVH